MSPNLRVALPECAIRQNCRGGRHPASPALRLLGGGCDEIATKRTNVTHSSNRPRAPSVQRAVRPEELLTGALSLGPASLLAGPFFYPPQKRWPWRILHPGVAHVGIGGNVSPLSCFQRDERIPIASRNRSSFSYLPSPRTCSGVHRSAYTTPAHPAEPWMPEQVRHYGLENGSNELPDQGQLIGGGRG